MKKASRIASYIALGALLASLGVAFAQGEMPEGVQFFEGPDGLLCFVWPDGSGGCYCPCEPSECPPIPTPTPSPKDTPTPGPEPTPTPEPLTFCHCEQGEGEGAEGRKNCHPVQYNPGHADHEWDYWSTDGTCDGWHH